MKKLVALWLFAIACAASPRPASAPAQMGRSDVAPNDPHQRIAYLSDQIAAQRAKEGLPPVQPPVMTCTECTAAPMAETQLPSQTCTPAGGDRCHDTCNLADTICTNAAEICKIASELPGDKWADEKCETAKTSCTDAQSQCCHCKP